MMKKLILILILVLPFFGFTNRNTGEQASNKIEAYYFHFTARCATCKAVEEQTRNDILTLYPKQVKDGSISFQSLNLDESSGKILGEKLKVSGQTLLIVKGDTKINITNQGFLYAVTNPNKLKSIIKEKIDQLLIK
jgi:hypothetical protein